MIVKSAVAIARYCGVAEAVIGLTIVALGTSLPELATSVVAAFKHNNDIAIGNVVGSNIFNVLLIVGITAMVTPIKVTRSTVNKDMRWAILASGLFLFCCFGQLPLSFQGCTISRTDGIVLLAFLPYSCM